MLGEERTHFPIEGREVVRLAAADPVAVSHYVDVSPVGAGISQIVRMITGHRPSPDQACGNEQPRAVSDDGNRVAALVNGHDERLCLRDGAKAIGIERPAGQQGGIELFRIGFGQKEIDGKSIRLLVMLHPLNLA